MKSGKYFHQPVLLKEVMSLLEPKTGETVIDATLGGGGYSLAILEKLGPKGTLLSVDLDHDAINNAGLFKGDRKNWILVQGNFRNIDKIAEKHKLNQINGIVADIGFSSHELDQSGRGFAFQKDEPLDMRFDQSQPEDARFYLANRSAGELEKIFREYGEEKFSRQIARKIKELEARGQKIRRTGELFEAIEAALPKPVKYKAGDSARRVFQALRITVNHELENLKDFLPKAFGLLSSGGRLAVVSFHSLEDREVKSYFNSMAKGCVCPPDFPQCLCGRSPKAKIINKKPITASEAELSANSRSRPAKLRGLIKL